MARKIAAMAQNTGQHLTRPEDMEFFGSAGTACLTLLLPITVITLTTLISHPLPQSFSSAINNLTSDASRFSLFHLRIYLYWFAGHLALYLLVPGKRVQGTLLRTGTKITYTTNAFTILLLVASTACYVAYTASQHLVWISYHTLPLVLASSLTALVLSVLLYTASFRRGVLLSTVGDAGSFFHDFWMGRELNPRLFGIDIKYVCELRPGMFLWFVLNLAHLCRQYVNFGAVSVEMWMVVVSQTVYIADSVWFESAILTTMDITTDGFGFMLAYGDLVWVPFTFSLQAHYLSDNPVTLSAPVLAIAIILNILGYTIFRTSNLQKNTFRSQPESAFAKRQKFIQTESGSKLLVSGWWGLSRHANYLGDWLLGLGWCMLTGFDNPLTYFYVVYFGILLVHRAGRDDHKCLGKYKKDWVKYCELVPWRIIPYIY